jgi:predicted RNA methylase
MSVARVVFISLLAVFSAAACAQQPATSTYEPTVGQEGKDVVWVPTPQALVDKMLDMAKLTPNDFVMDLGSGDGRTVITAAKRGARAVGVEYNPQMVELSKRNAQKEGVADRADFMKADLFETDFSKATVITMFLLPDINKTPQGDVTLKQQYQMLSGTLRTAERTVPIEGKVRGEEITFKAGGKEYRGRMNGKQLELKS